MADKKTDPLAALSDHANDRNTLEFAEVILHGKIRFGKGEVVRFEDPRVAAYLDVAFNGTEFTDKEPTRTITADDINFDPDDPSGNETLDPHTKITGREGITDGTTVHQQLTGEAPSERAELEVESVVDTRTHTAGSK